MKPVLITGSRGFIGGHLRRRLETEKVEYYEIERQLGSDLVSCILPRKNEVSRVYHLAAQTDARCLDAERDARDNIIASLRIFQRYGDAAVFTSSSMVNYPFVPYAIAKRACEDYARLFGAAIVRLCNIYGDGGHSVFERFAADDELLIAGNGEQRRTYAHVSKAVEALIAAKPNTMTVLPGEELSVNQVATRWPDKPRRYVPAGAFDLADARQMPVNRMVA